MALGAGAQGVPWSQMTPEERAAYSGTGSAQAPSTSIAAQTTGTNVGKIPRYALTSRPADEENLREVLDVAGIGALLPHTQAFRPKAYDPNAANFALQLPGGVEGFQTSLTNQANMSGQDADYYRNMAKSEAGGALSADQQFGALMGQGGDDYKRSIMQLWQGQEQFRGDQARAVGAYDQLGAQFGQDYGRASDAYGQGQQALDLTRSAALGEQPSVAELQQRQGLQSAVAGQVAAANSGPYNPAAALVAGQRGQTMQQQAYLQGSQLRAGEMAQARGQYGQMVGQQQGAAQGLGAMGQAFGGLQTGAAQALGAQGQAYSNATQNWTAGLGAMSAQQAGLAQAQAGQLRQQALGYGGLSETAKGTGLQAYDQVANIGAQAQRGNIELEQMKAAQTTELNKALQEREQFNQETSAKTAEKNMDFYGKLIGSGVGGGGLGGIVSDERSKTALSHAYSEIDYLRTALADMYRKQGGEQRQPSASDRYGDGLDTAPRATGSARFGDGLDAQPKQTDVYQWGPPPAPKPRQYDSYNWGPEPPVSNELARTEPVGYRYRPEARAAFPSMTAPGQRYGVTAQDLEQAGPVGRSMVETGPGGMKTIDPGQASGAMLAALGEQKREIDQLRTELERMRGAR